MTNLGDYSSNQLLPRVEVVFLFFFLLKRVNLLNFRLNFKCLGISKWAT